MLQVGERPIYVGSTLYPDQRKYRWSQMVPEANFVVLEKHIALADLVSRHDYWQSLIRDTTDEPMIEGRPTIKKIDRLLYSSQ